MASLHISIFTSSDLRATIGLLKTVDREVSNQIRRAVKTVSTSEWQQEVQVGVRKDIHQRVLANTANVSVTNTNVNLRAGNSTKLLRGGARISDLTKAAEFGAGQEKTASYTARSRKGKTYQVRNRHTTRQLPSPSRTGWAVYPAAAKFIPRMAALYVQTTMRTFYEAIEKGS